MNIPDEVFEQAKEAGEGNNADYRVMAEWARKEALREAADAVRKNAGQEDEKGICEGVSNWPDASARTYSFAAREAIEAIRALAEES